MKIRIFALAKELGLDNKTLIEHCNAAGIEVKNSALASITPKERDRVVAFIEGGSAPAAPAPVAEAPKTSAPKNPTREVTDRHTKTLRDIPPMTSRPGRPETTGEPEAAPATAVAEAESTDASPEVEEAVEPVAETVPEEISAEKAPTEETSSQEVTAESTSEATSEEEVVEEPEDVAAGTVDETVDEKQTPDEESAADKEADSPSADGEKTSEAKDGEAKDDESGGQPDDGPKRSAPMKRGDYVSPGGQGAKPRAIPQMVSRPTADRRNRRRGGDKPKPGNFPAMAAVPKFESPKPKTPKKKEEDAPAQRPDMKLTPDMLDGKNHISPLAGIIKAKEERDKSAKHGKKLRRDDDQPGRRPPGGNVGRRKGRYDNEDGGRGGYRGKRSKKAAPLKTEATIELPITVRSLSEAIGRPAKDIQGILFKEGQIATINDPLEEETSMMIALELGVDLEVKRGRDIEEELTARLDQEDNPDSLAVRPPVVTILGHVDHGKTTLLDKIRESNVVDGEAGGITQHIRAYQVTHDDKQITFVDTPGHAAFSEMRARGATVTDIVVLVVAADDGVMPQTIESIQHVRAAGVPLIVAMNKIDRPDNDQQRVLQELAGQEVLPVEWGGDTEVIRTSAITGDGIDDLLETINITAELNEYTANPDRSSVGVCLEAFQDEGRGVVAWVIVQKGTLRVGDDLLCGPAFGRVRAMYNDMGQQITEAHPSQPVKISGLNIVPRPGDHFFEMTDIEEARETAEERRNRDRSVELAQKGRGTKKLTDFLEGNEGDVKKLPLIVKADTPGSLEALKTEMRKFDHPEVRVDLIASGVGGVNESDVSLANASDAVIIAFQVIPDERAADLAETEGVDIRRYSIIYQVTDQIKDELEGLLEPERREVPTGRALVLQTFTFSRTGKIAGCRILSGTISRNDRVHVIRDQKIVNSYPLASLRREKDDVKEVRDGMECGIRLDGFNDIKEGDLLEAYRIDVVKRTLAATASAS